MSGLPVSVVIPAYNEGESIRAVVAELHAELKRLGVEGEIVVVDDGSTDGTAAAVDPAQARVITHPANRGYGRSLMTGIEAAKHDWVLMIDADGSYPPSEALRLLQHAPAFDLVIGAREGAHFWGTRTKTFLRWVYLRIASFVAGETLPDANSGLRLVRKALVDQGPVRCLGYSFTTTMTLSFLVQGRLVKFLPIAFRARTGGRSKVHPVRDILRTLQIMTQVIIVYNPLKLFAGIAALAGALGLAFAIAWHLRGAGEHLIAAGFCALGTLLAFGIGCVLDAIRMRD